ncbi:MAG: hypothetical protein AAFQ82_17415 [Myxococcota bacterium]
MKCHLFVVALGVLLPNSILAAPVHAPINYHDVWSAKEERNAEPEPREFVFINYFMSRFTATNQLADPVGRSETLTLLV